MQRCVLLRVLQQSLEEAVALSFSLGHLLLRRTRFARFLARSHDLSQERCGFGVADPYGLELEQVEVSGRTLIQPSDHAHMLGARIRYDPNGFPCLDSHEIREELAEVVMIALLELVLDDHRTTVFVFGDEVDTEGAHGLLAFDTAELKAGSLVEDIDVLFQPLGEVECFVLPHLPQCYTLDSSDHMSQSRQLKFGSRGLRGEVGGRASERYCFRGFSRVNGPLGDWVIVSVPAPAFRIAPIDERIRGSGFHGGL